MTPEEKAKYYIEQLGKEGAWRQAADEWHNSDTDEEREYYSKVMDAVNAL